MFFIAAAEPLRTEKHSVQEGSGRAIAYGERLFTKYKNYERVIEIVES